MNDAELAEKRHMADAALRRAIELHAEAYHLDDDDDVLEDFVIITVWHNFGDDTMSYGRATSRGDASGMPHHIGLGILERGLMSMRAEIARIDEDDE